MKNEKQPAPRPDDEVRFTGLMRRADRARFKYFCERIGVEMERLGTQWIIERLEQEEKRLLDARDRESKPPRK